jgi:hypothetical protein
VEIVKSREKQPNSGRKKYEGSCCLCGSSSTSRWYHRINVNGTICKECQSKDRYIKNVADYVGKRKNWGKTYAGAKNIAKSKKIEWTITEDEWVEKTKECFYCKELINHQTTGGTKLDRVNNSLGYTKLNTVGCCRQCNVAKNNYSLGNFKDWVAKVYSTLSSIDLTQVIEDNDATALKGKV